MLRLLLDENVPFAAARRLADDGHDVSHIATLAPGASDPDVIAMAKQLGRMLVSYDSDIGTRLFLNGDAPPVGVVYVRDPPAAPLVGAEEIAEVLAAVDPIGAFVVVRHGRVRVQPLPPHP